MSFGLCLLLCELTKKPYWDTIAVMIDQRKTMRMDTLARVVIKGHNNEEILLRDISVTGCRLGCPLNTQIELNIRYFLEIVPEGITKIDAFELIVESKWKKDCSDSFDIGFFILEFPRGIQFQNYVDYLSWRYNQGISFTGQ